MRLFVHGHGVLAAPGANGDRRNLFSVQSFIDCPLRARQALDGEGVHLFPGQAMLICGFLSESAHGGAGVGVLEPVEKHMVE